MTLLFAIAAASFATLSLVVYVVNARLYQRSRTQASTPLPAVSILIPARNEEDKISDVLESVLASRDIEFEVLVLDDHSDDRTAALVDAMSTYDNRVQLLEGRPLPTGWCGKQFACSQLAEAASNEILLFIDADVRLTPDALARTTDELVRREVALLSGVPQQVTSGFSDGLLIPLIHFILLGYLPLWMSRKENKASLAAGCGQFFLTRKSAYLRAGGHAAIKSSMHDGLKLPQIYRTVGETTDLIDLTDVAECRMYERPADVWSGLSKNAVEGIAAPTRIAPFTMLLFVGHVLPVILLAVSLLTASPTAAIVSTFACACSFAVRIHAARRFRQPLWSALLHPVGVLAFLSIQWTALIRHLLGHRPTWRGRGVAQVESLTGEKHSEATSETSVLTPGSV